MSLVPECPSHNDKVPSLIHSGQCQIKWFHWCTHSTQTPRKQGLEIDTNSFSNEKINMLRYPYPEDRFFFFFFNLVTSDISIILREITLTSSYSTCEPVSMESEIW